MDDKQLKKLLLMALGSDQDGEVLAAVAAVKRLMKKHKVDSHWLVARLTGGPPPKLSRNAVTWEDTLLYVCENRELLNPREEDFIVSLVRQYQTHSEWEPSEKQLGWLVSIYIKLKEYE